MPPPPVPRLTLTALLQKVRDECRRIYHENNEVLVSALNTKITARIRPVEKENIELRACLAELKEEVRGLRVSVEAKQILRSDPNTERLNELEVDVGRCWKILLNQYPDIENQFRDSAV